MYTQFLVKEKQLKIGVIKGLENPTDMGTTRHPVKKFLELRDLAGVYPGPDNEGIPEVEISAVETETCDNFAELLDALGIALSTCARRGRKA